MIATIKYRTYSRANFASEPEEIIKTKEVICDEIDVDGNTIKFLTDRGVGSYKPLFILNIDNLIQVDTEFSDE